jgi:hypothetical protein
VILRRLYLYLVSAASLGVLAIGLALLGTTVLLFVFNDPSSQYNRPELAGFTAMVLVAGPVWAIHFWFARRYAMRDAADRASAIRRLYLYWACLGGSLGAALAISITAGDLLRPLIDTCTAFGPQKNPAGFPPSVVDCSATTANWLNTSQAAWFAVVALGVWALHFWVAGRDRAAVGEAGASATLRRWYMYPALLVGLLMMLAGLAGALQVGWLKLVQSPLGNYQFVGDGAGEAIAGFLLWGFHARTVARNHIADDRHSTLRALQGFIVVAVSIAVALSGASMILYYALARALGVTSPGGVNSNDIAGALAAPASSLLVYGVGWVLVRRRLTRDAGTQEADRQAAIRRLYTNLAALVSLVAWAIGAGGLVWTLAEQVEAPVIGVSASDWRDPVSLWVTLLVVGAAVWLAHWRHAPWAADRQSLSRRLYVWAAMLGSVLVVLAGGVAMLNALLRQLFSTQPKLNDPSNLDFGHALAVILVAAAVGIYHWRVLRADAFARPPRVAAPEATPVIAHPVEHLAPQTAAATPVDAHSRRYTLVVTDATEDDIHQALAALPPQAGYELTPSTEPAAIDGH